MTAASANEGVGISQWEQKAGRGGGIATLLAGCENELLKQDTKIYNIEFQQSLKISSIFKHKAYDFFF